MKSGHSLKDTILRDKYNALIFDQAMGREIYLVGGYVRDLMRNIHSRDRDFIVRRNVLSFAKKIQQIAGGTIVTFKSKRTVRLSMKGGYSFDFSELHGSVENDLSQRDFTMNALAWSPKSGIIDLYGGISDIHRRIVRCISSQNLLADPLRMIRAYRFSSDLNGTVEVATHRNIKQYHEKILLASDERITLELFHLLNANHSARHLAMAYRAGILGAVYHLSTGILQGIIKDMDSLECKILQHLPADIKVLLHDIFSQNLTYKGLLCLHLLGIGSRDGLRGARLSMSSKIYDRISSVIRWLPELRKAGDVDSQRLFRIFMESSDGALDLLIISERLDLLSRLRTFQRIWRKGLLSSRQIMDISGLGEGPELGRLILALKRAHFERRLKSRSEAAAFIRDFSRRTNGDII